MASSDKIYSLQTARFLAALSVYLFHVTPQYVAMGGDEQGWFFQASRFGMIGVDVFFVISGYVIFHSTRNISGGRSSLQFLFRRFGRIYLGFWPIFAAALVIEQWFPTENVWNWVTSGFLLEYNVYKLLVPVSWSLTYELYFYLCFAPLVFFGLKRRVSLIACLAAVAIAAVFFTQGKSLFFASPYVLEFLMGVGIAAARPFISRRGIPFIALVMIVGGLIAGVERGALEHPERLLTFGVAAAGIVLLLTSIEARWGWSRSSFLQLLGDASYGIYLIHVPILTPLIIWGLRDFLALGGAQIGFLGWTMLTISLALVYHLTVEKPLYQAYARRVKAFFERQHSW